MNGLESVHFLQNSYRKILNSMSRPGVFEKLEKDYSEEIGDIELFFGTYSIMRVLLDAETKFKIYSDNEEKTSKFIKEITGGVISPVEESEFVFIDSKSMIGIGEILKDVNKGTLISPEFGATVICEVDSVFLGEEMIASGPGIKGEKKLKMPLVKLWKEAREEKILEYPMGIDLIFVDREGNILSIPRTTKIREEES